MSQSNLRSVLETAILLFVCSAWAPQVLWGKGYGDLALALASSGVALVLLFYIIRRGKLPARWLDVIRPTTIDSGLLYGTSLVSMSFAAHFLHDQDNVMVLASFWSSMANNVSFALLLCMPNTYDSWPSRLFRLLVSFCLIAPFFPIHLGFLAASLAVCEACLELVQRGMKKSFTLGEALLVVQYVGLATCDLAHYILTQHQFKQRRKVDLALQSGLLGCIWLAAALIPFFKQDAPVNALHFYSVVAVFLGLVVAPMAAHVLGGENPIWFVRDFTFSTFDHVYLLAYWVVILALALPLIHSQVSKLPLVVIRKLYHILALVLFAPAIRYTRDFLSLGFGVAAGLALLFEYIRACRVFPLGTWLDKYMRSYTDDRDDGIFILTHLYLLLGCAVSVWAAKPEEQIVAYAGVLILGAGDSAAAIIGSQFGKYKWLPSARKTVEGTLSGIAAVLVVAELLFATDFNRQRMIFACLATLALEAFTTQIDNLVLPIVFTSCLRIF